MSNLLTAGFARLDGLTDVGAGHLIAQVDKASDNPNARLSLAIAGLLILAVLILVATVIYWRETRPSEDSTVESRMVSAPTVPPATPTVTSEPPTVPSTPPTAAFELPTVPSSSGLVDESQLGSGRSVDIPTN